MNLPFEPGIGGMQPMLERGTDSRHTGPRNCDITKKCASRAMERVHRRSYLKESAFCNPGASTTGDVRASRCMQAKKRDVKKMSLSNVCR